MEVEHINFVVLKLSDEERQWVHSVMQNPLCGQHPNDEELHNWLNQPSDNPHLSEDEIKNLHEFLNEPL